MSNELARVVTASLTVEGRSVAHDNMNVIMILTSDNSVLNSDNRWMEVTPTDAGSIFGSYSAVAEHATVVGATTPNATQVGGKLIIGYHRATTEEVAEKKAYIAGGQIDEPVFLSEVKKITNGGIAVDIDGTVTPILEIDLSSATSTQDVVTALNIELSPVTFSYDGFAFKCVIKNTGNNVSLSDVPNSDPLAGLLKLTLGSGAASHEYEAAKTLEPETRLEALTALKSQVNFKGVSFIDRLLDAEIIPIATWATANQVLVYETFYDEKYTVADDSNVCWQVKMSGLRSFRMLWLNDRRYATAYMARLHTVNFNGENTTLTMHLKELPVLPEKISDDLWSKLDRVGLDPYTTTKDTANVLCSSGNDYVDNEYNLNAFINHIQTDNFNLLKTAFTKLAQTEEDGQLIVDCCERTARRFVRANFIAPGEWSNANVLGNREAFLRAIRSDGYYFQIGSFADQPQSDRERRIAPVVQGAIKNAGAIHKLDILINFNK